MLFLKQQRAAPTYRRRNWLAVFVKVHQQRLCLFLEISNQYVFSDERPGVNRQGLRSSRDVPWVELNITPPTLDMTELRG